MRLAIDFLEARFRAPVFSSRGRERSRPLLIVSLEGSDGCTGYGEAAPLESYDGTSVDAVRAAIEAFEEPLAASDGHDRERLLEACRARAALPQALAAIDLALWDLAGKRAALPVWRLLGAGEGVSTDVNATLGAENVEAAAEQAAAARAAGFRCVKVKVGAGQDERRVAAARDAAGDGLAIRVDANGAWSVPAALHALTELAPYGIELCEEPVHGIDELRLLVGATGIPLAIDETAALPGALERRWCAAACLKLTRSGGLSGVLSDAAKARLCGYELYLGSTFDGPLGIAAALHAACSIRPDRPSGLATLALFERPDPLPATDGHIAPPVGPGLGDGLVDWYR